MTSPGATIVGRVGLRVIPDTSRFREDLKAKLAKMKDLTVKVKVEPDMDGFMTKVQAAARAASKSAKVKVPVEAETKDGLFSSTTSSLSNLMSRIRAVVREMRLIRQESKRTGDEISRWRRFINQASAPLARMSSVLSRIRDSVQRVTRLYREGQFVPVGVDNILGQTILTTQRVRGLALAWRQVQDVIDRVRAGTLNFRVLVDRATTSVRNLGNAFTQGVQNGFRATFDSLSTSITRVRDTLRSLPSALGSGFRSSIDGISSAFTRMRDTIRGIPDVLRRINFSESARSVRATDTEVRRLSRSIRDTDRASQSLWQRWRTPGGDMEWLRVGIRKVTGGFQALTRGVLTTFRVITQVIGPLLSVGAIAFALVVAGAGITAAWGAASAAILAIPPAIMLIGLPIAAVALGLDGIKKAAQRVAPEFENLKRLTSQAFETGLAPAFRLLEGIFPTLNLGMVRVALGLSDLATDLAGFLTQGTQLDNLKRSFDNIAFAVSSPAMKNGLRGILDSLLQLTAMPEAVDVLTGAIETLGLELSLSIARMSDGTLQKAFEGLKGTLQSLSGAFVSLVENGIRTFTEAAPGVNKFIDDITVFFNRFDWERLGKAVGNVFAGLGDVFKNVDDATIESITQAFERLGELFQDPAFQQDLNEIIRALPVAIDMIRWFADTFIGILAELSGYLQMWQDGSAFGGLVGFIRGLFSDSTTEAQTGGQNLNNAVTSSIGQLPGLVGTLIGPLPGVVGTVMGELPRLAGEKANQIPGAIQPGIASAGATMQNGVNSWNGTVNSGLGVLHGSIQTGMAKMQGSVNTGTAGMNSAMRSGMAGFSSEARTGVNTASTNVQSGVTQMQSQVRAQESGFRSVGSFLIQGLINGLRSSGSSLIAAAVNLATAAYRAAKSALGIKSPSTLFAELGKFSVLGAVVGFKKTTPKLVKSAEQMVAKVSDAATGLRSAFEIDSSFTDRLSGIQPATGRMDSFVRTQVESDGFGGIADKVASALEGWTVDIDGNGVAKMVNKSNTRNRRR